MGDHAEEACVAIAYDHETDAIGQKVDLPWSVSLQAMITLKPGEFEFAVARCVLTHVPRLVSFLISKPRLPIRCLVSRPDSEPRPRDPALRVA